MSDEMEEIIDEKQEMEKVAKVVHGKALPALLSSVECLPLQTFFPAAGPFAGACIPS